ncbi:MAG: 50S ribosomal protein L31 [Chloroflexi bacterium]|nr:50S ribosomal protein L31 [Chloroflexota bacterium]
MKKDIHPRYYPEATVTCACGNSWKVGATQESLTTDVCSRCHPFFTGQMQRIVDRGGQVERFTKRMEEAQRMQQEAEEREAARIQRARARQLVEIVDEEEVEPIEPEETAKE